MNKPFYVKKIETFDIKNILNFINKNNVYYDHKFNELYNRKVLFKKVFSQVIVDRSIVKNQELYINFMMFLSPLLKKLNTRYGSGTLWKMQLAKMHGNGSIIKPHVDSGLEFLFSHRIHIPIITNENIHFYIEDKKFNLKSNSVYEVNNSKEHSVINENKNDFERVHLIIDFLENKYFPFLLTETN
jgi:hypothetical protein